MIYVKVVKRQGGEELHTAERTEFDANTGKMTIHFNEKASYAIDMLSGDAIYVMTMTGQTMSSHRPR